MQKKKQKKPIKQILLFTAIVIIVLLLIFAEDIIKLTNKNKLNLAQNSENELISNEPNIPVLSAGMIPVKWENGNWIITTADDKNWYDYKVGKPAYIMLNDGTYQSELIRGMEQNGQKLADDNVGVGVPDDPSIRGTIFVWIPKYAHNISTDQLKYVKEDTQIQENWIVPDMFLYKQESKTVPDFLLNGVWIQKDIDLSHLNKIEEMKKEEGKYGFLANTFGISALNEVTYQSEIERYLKLVDNSIINEPNNANRIILKIVNTSKVEKMKAEAILDVNAMEVTINVTYSKNKIAKIEDSKGNILTENSTTAVDRDIPSNGSYYYTITDKLGYTKRLKVQVNITRTITFNINGGTKTVASITAGYGENITMPIPERKYTISYNTGGNGTIPSTNVEYTFNGWYTQATDGEKREYITMPKNNQVLYAQWSPEGVSLPNFPNEDYLGNWYSNSSLTTAVGRVGDIYVPMQNTTLYAGYKSAIYAFYYNDRTLAFNTVNSGIEGKTAKFSYGEISNTHLTGDNAPWGLYYVDRVVFLDVITPKYTSYWFTGSDFTEIDTRYIRTNNVTDMKGMFQMCRRLKSLDLSNWNTSKVTDMSWMFYYCDDLISLDLSSFNTSKVTDVSYMFGNCDALTNLDLSNFNTNNVTTMESMFYNCNSLTSLNLSNFRTSKVTSMRNMFYNCNQLTNLNLSNISTINVTNMNSMFYMCRGLTTLDLSGFNTNKVTNMSQMFKYCNNLKTIYVGSFWYVPSNVSDMFYSCGTSTVTKK